MTDRIRSAYNVIAETRGDWVSIADIRDMIGSYQATKELVDAGLKSMIHDPDVSIVPENNQKVLSERKRAAAVVIGDQDKHLISIH
ncbi:hypothetical protein ACWEU6_36295 [Streptosporangium sandarakinum]|uniref:hypothetical protein n=1 Tax=Streptosporangium sandarakinum TaxID=1260955 RepID=UPI0036CEE694